jgi:hypothetical protein
MPFGKQLCGEQDRGPTGAAAHFETALRPVQKALGGLESGGMKPAMRQIAPRPRFLLLAGSLPFHKAHFDRLGEEKAKGNLENFRVAFQAGSTSAIATSRH